ncbi:MAG: Flp pilus assembly complex ATPase component TadA [Candidatus Omnitrophica bacterium]|nr:Flp pilus assembly complex ATPase component TadA [Candidatus Omnitrophota bacterium]
MPPKKRFPLGQLLVERKILTPEQLGIALKKQEETGEQLGAILLDLGFIDEEAVFLPFVAGQYGVDYVDLKQRNIPKDIINKIPAKFASYYRVLPYQYSNGVLTLATPRPFDVLIMDEIGVLVKDKIQTVLASEKDVIDAIRHYYGVGADTIEQMMGTVSQPAAQEEINEIDEIESDASISRFLNQILYQAFKDRATDVHIEPFEDELKIRYRVDGVLYDAKVPSNLVHFKDSINSRIKILSNLNIAEKRAPQDGRFKVRVQDTDLDFRVSFLPTPNGESVVLRLLNTSTLYSLEQLGIIERNQKILQDLINKPHGIIFITGPTGSGKTTTLYSCLSRVNTDEKKVITIEDPIEYQLKGMTQIQINPAVGLTFAQGLRSMLRHDPDIMMVGEVRDVETAEIAIQVALTGHLVLSTLHTNDAASGVTRLIDMGVEPYLITSTVECFIAQRLIRLLCQKCKKKVQISEEILKDLEPDIAGDFDGMVWQAGGCETCKQTGYSGREGIYEFLLMNDEIRQLVMERATSGKVKDAAVRAGMKTLRQSGWEKVLRGLTTPEEIIRVTQEEN